MVIKSIDSATWTKYTLGDMLMFDIIPITGMIMQGKHMAIINHNLIIIEVNMCKKFDRYNSGDRNYGDSFESRRISCVINIS